MADDDGFIPYGHKRKNTSKTPIIGNTVGIIASSSNHRHDRTPPQNDLALVNTALSESKIQIWHINPFDFATGSQEELPKNYTDQCLTNISDKLDGDVERAIAQSLNPNSGEGIALFVSDKKPDWSDYALYKMAQVSLIYDHNVDATLEKLVESSHLLNLWIDCVVRICRLIDIYGPSLIYGIRMVIRNTSKRGGRGRSNHDELYTTTPDDDSITNKPLLSATMVNVEIWFEPESVTLSAPIVIRSRRANLERSIKQFIGTLKQRYVRRPQWNTNGNHVQIPPLANSMMVRTRVVDKNGKWVDDD